MPDVAARKNNKGQPIKTDPSMRKMVVMRE
jgi:hypothetical protein